MNLELLLLRDIWNINKINLRSISTKQKVRILGFTSVRITIIKETYTIVSLRALPQSCRIRIDLENIPQVDKFITIHVVKD